MGLLGIGKGLVKTLGGVVTGDEEMIVKGLKKIAINTVTTGAQILANEVWDKAHEDDDDDD